MDENSGAKLAPIAASAKAHSKRKAKKNDYYVAFLDILGFKEIGSANGSRNKISRIRKKIDDWEDKLKKHSIKRKIRVHKMSDSLVLGIKSDIPNALMNFLEACRKLQGDLYSLNTPIIIRGAIAKGEYHITKEIAYGDGVINAYLYQEQHCKYPRIIISSNMVLGNIMSNGLSDYDANRLLFLDSDKYYFVDTLKYCFLDKASNDPACDKFEEFVLGQLDYADQEIREKYIWLHDDFIRVKMLRRLKELKNTQNTKSNGRELYIRMKIIYTAIYRSVLDDGSLDI